MTPVDRESVIARAEQRFPAPELLPARLCPWCVLPMTGEHAPSCNYAIVRDLIAALRAVPVEPGWQPIASAPKDGTPIRAFSPDLIHEDFNPSGSVEAYWQDDEGWIGAVWCGEHDHWVAKTIQPTHFKLLPTPPVDQPIAKEQE